MKIVVTWWTWFLWRHLVDSLLMYGHVVWVVSRSKEKVTALWWERVEWIQRDPYHDDFPWRDIELAEVVIHLMGEPLSVWRWSKKKRIRLRDSRVMTTNKLVKALPESCHTFICASAIGWYPSLRKGVFTENAKWLPPKTFLQKLTHEREAAANKAQTASRRVINLRTWLVIWKDGWIYPKIRKATYRWWWVILGHPKRPCSWIAVEDRVGGVSHCLVEGDKISWPVNLTAPHPVTRWACTRAVAKVLNRPVRMIVPWFLLRLVLWKWSELFTSRQEVRPVVLLNGKYRFKWNDLREYLAYLHRK